MKNSLSFNERFLNSFVKHSSSKIMHLELNPKYKASLENVIKKLGIDAHLINSFNASGETITLSASREELEKILEAPDTDFEVDKDEQEDYPLITPEGLKAIIKDYLADRI